MKILLIAGGWSSEREISLEGAHALDSVLRDMGHQVTFFDLAERFDQLLATASAHDFAFINLHGAPGEDGLVQAMLDNIGCPYQGSDPVGSFLALNKAAAKQIFRLRGLPTPDWRLYATAPSDAWQCPFPYPVFIKSNTGGSSLRLGRAKNKDEARKLFSEILEKGDCAILEPELKGRDVTCGVVGSDALPPVLIEPAAGDFFDYASKYQAGGARELCPPPLQKNTIEEIRELALRAHKALGLYGYSRTDFILQDSGEVQILEVNTLPGMTGASLVRREAAAAGITFDDLLSRLIDSGLRRHKQAWASS